ncbi:MAG: hypothetical protein M3464_19395 [Chloroflexota bacterium]|nr:hypothetical protein [Chloroflexota bacterium]
MATIQHALDFLQEASRVRNPNDGDYDDWVEARDVLPFLRRTTAGDVPVLVSDLDAYVYAVMVPLTQLEGDDFWSDLAGWRLDPSEGWTSWITSRDNEDSLRGHIYHPLDGTFSRILDAGEAVVFDRYFVAREPQNYAEPNQKLIHVAGAHWDAERRSYCRLNEHGDIVEVAKETTLPNSRPNDVLYTVEAESLDHYLFVSGQALVRLFDFGRSPHRDRGDRANCDIEDVLRPVTGDGIVAQMEIERRPTRIERVRLRGVQVLRELPGRKRWLSRYRPGRPETVSFIIQDMKHGVVREYPGDRVTPLGTSVEEDWPPLISPAYFRPEVLSRFKTDPDKYRLTGTSIACRGAWSLRSYDINEAGQVYVYLKDLWEELPHAEQLYWKSFNERPQAGLAQRSIDQDFDRKPWTGPDPLGDLKQTLASFPTATQNGAAVAIWSANKVRAGRRAFDQLHYVVTEARKEWADQIVELDKEVVEGLQKTPIEATAVALGVTVMQKGSINLLRDSLSAIGVDSATIVAIHGPLYILHQLRSKSGAAHRGGSRPEVGPSVNYRAHYRGLVADVAIAMSLLTEQVRAGAFDLPLPSASSS